MERITEDKIFESYRDYLNYQIDKLNREYIKHYDDGQRRAIEILFDGIDKKSKILDCGCGDGCGLKCFKDMGFNNVAGIDIRRDWIETLQKQGYEYFICDMHDLRIFGDNEFDIIWASHVLEHAYDPEKVLAEWKRILKPSGAIILVLPYPVSIDTEHKRRAHCGAKKIGIDINDEAKTLCGYLQNRDFKIIDKRFDDFREKETWLVLGLVR